jgi:hypothetical protein
MVTSPSGAHGHAAPFLSARSTYQREHGSIEEYGTILLAGWSTEVTVEEASAEDHLGILGCRSTQKCALPGDSSGCVRCPHKAFCG